MAKLIVGQNDLATTHPELAKEWHPTKNGTLKPTDVSAGSERKVWWLLPYDDPATGKHFNFEWTASVYSRTRGVGCPFLSNQAIWIGFNDLATTHPELAKEWHPTKNGTLKPTDVTTGSNKKVWWLFQYNDPNTGKYFDFEWETTVVNRTTKNFGCPYLSGATVWTGFNDLATTHPELAKEWHPTKNGMLMPTDVTAGSKKKVWWLFPYDDPKTGKHFDFEWSTSVKQRKDGTKCPYLVGQAVLIGFNDLATTHPELAKEWHPTKNGTLKPTDVVAGSGKKVWWLFPYNDPKTGKHFDFEWEATIFSRTRQNIGCPYLSGAAVWTGFNDLATTNPKLAKEWHPTKNGTLKPTDITANSNKKAWWLLPYDDPKTGRHFDFEWNAIINSRTTRNLRCPYLSGAAVWSGFNDLATTNPELAKEWHPTKNGTLKPTDVTVSSGKKVWWLFPYDDPKTGKHFDFEWEAVIYSRVNGACCPFLASSKGEKFISSLFDNKQVKYVCEKTFNDLVCKSKLKIDFFVNDSIAIEYDGLQHFESFDWFGGIKALNSSVKRDNLKSQYCFDKEIPLLRIPYIYDARKEEGKARIEQFVLDFIETGIVPTEILNFYKKQKNNNYYKLFSTNKIKKAA